MRWANAAVLTVLLVSFGCSHIRDRSLDEPISAGNFPEPTGRVPEMVASNATSGGAPTLESVDLASLWKIAQEHNSILSEAAAEVQEARGRAVQASKYPNPTFLYTGDALGDRASPSGAASFLMTQEILIAGKRRLDMAVAASSTEIASITLSAKEFQVLTAIRRAYYEYSASSEAVRVQEGNLVAHEDAVTLTRKLVKEGGKLPQADLLRAQSVLAQARINQTRNQIAMTTAWKNLAARVGVPDLAMPRIVPDLPKSVPTWAEEVVVKRVLSVHADLRAATEAVEKARLELDRVRAEAGPNVRVGAGYTRDSRFEGPHGSQGAIVAVETSFPIWDRRQGDILAAQARWIQVQAARQSTATRLHRQTTEAFGRYLSARQQLERFTTEVIPGLEECLRLVRKRYEVGKTPEGFVDITTAVETLNEAKLLRAEARRSVWDAVTDLEGLMQIPVSEDQCSARATP
jgi:cobalt-zinc-cadmium efflux system outer membrane protein